MKNNTGGSSRVPFQLSTLALAVSMGIAGAASADTLSIQGSWLDFEAGKDARTHAISCDTPACEDSNIKSYPTEKHESDFDNSFSGAFKWTHETNGNGLWGSNDLAIGGSFFKDESSKDNLDTTQGGSTSARTYGTGFGVVDSSTADISSVQDDVWYVTGDVEFGWNSKQGDADVRTFIGARFAVLEYERNATHNFPRGSETTDQWNFDGEEKSKFIGVGPRVGASIKQPIAGSKNLAVTAAISGGVLFGNLEREYHVSSYTNPGGGALDDKRSREFVPFADVEAALSYQINDGLFVEAGYQYSYQDDIILLGSVCTDASIDDAKPDNSSCGDDKSNAQSHGPFLRVTFPF